MKKFKTVTFEIDLEIDEVNKNELDILGTKIINKINKDTRRIISFRNLFKRNKITIKRVTTKTFPL